jgi:secreted trypsin-like serine protease
MDIIEGQDVEVGEYPYYVRLQSFTLSQCGGSLIAPRVVLSAAHCGEQGTEFVGTTAYVGAYYEPLNPTLPNDPSVVKVPIVQQRIHDLYETLTKGFLDNDFMLLRLANDAVPPNTKNVQFELSDNAADLLGDVTAIGFGVTDLTGTTPDILQEVDLIARSDEVCQQQYDDIGEGDDFNGDIQVCTINGGGKDTCFVSCCYINGWNPAVNLHSWTNKFVLCHNPGRFRRTSHQDSQWCSLPSWNYVLWWD